MGSFSPEIVDDYAAALQAYVSTEEEGALHRAYSIGRKALGAGVGLLDMVDMHHRALAAMADEPGEAREGTRPRIELASRFLAESLSPFELFHRSRHEANAALRRLNMIMEHEAKRIAHALHDEAGQLLATVYLELAGVAREAPLPVRERVSRINGHLDEVREQLRRISHELRPLILDQLGLLPALRFLTNGVIERTGLVVTAQGSTDGRLAEPIETTVYRVVQEALTNVSKHAAATRVDVRVWVEEGSLHCTVEDDGVGFDPAAVGDPRGGHGLGLIGLRERVEALHGTVRVESSRGAGTVLHVALPEERSEVDARNSS